MKKMHIVIAIVAFVFALTSALQADLIVTTITQADIDALDSGDIVWNAQFFPGKGSLPDVQYSVGLGLNGFETPRGTTTWSQSPSVNTLSVGMTAGNTLQASANSGDTVMRGISDPFNEIWVFIRDTTPLSDPGDFLEVSNITDGTNTFPTLFAEPENGFAGFKIRYDTFPSNIGEFNLTADLIHEHIGSGGKDWNVNVVGVIPEPSTIALLLISLTTLFLLRTKK